MGINEPVRVEQEHVVSAQRDSFLGEGFVGIDTDEEVIRAKLADLSGIVSDLNSAVVEMMSRDSDIRIEDKLQERIGTIYDGLKQSGDDIEEAIKQTRRPLQ